MSEKEPKSEDRLGENIEHSIGDDLSVNINVTRSIGNTPDAETCQYAGKKQV